MLRALPTREPVVINLDQLKIGQSPVCVAGPHWDPVDALIATLCEAELAWAETRLLALGELAEVIRDRAQRLGMSTFASVAAQTHDLAQGQDSVAMAANLARLVRVGEASLSAILDMDEPNG